MKKNVQLLCLILIFILSRSGLAMEGFTPSGRLESGFNKEAFIASAEAGKILKIGLVDCIAYALKNNSEILIKRLEPKIKEDEIKIAKSDFEPTLKFTPTLRENNKLPTSSLGGIDLSKSRDIDFNGSLSGKFITGTEYNLELINEKYKSNSASQLLNHYYAAEPKITITQPLFRDFGILVNTADIIIARNNKAQSEENFKDTVMATITKTKVAYYNYIYYLGNYAFMRSSLEQAKSLLEIIKARHAKGLASSVDLLEGETAVAQREKALIGVESSLKKAEDELKLITNLVDDPELWNARLELIDGQPEFTPTPRELVWGFNEQELNLTKCLENAFEFRPDYIARRIDLRNRDIKIKVAKNALFPTLDLVGSYGINGLGKDFRMAFKDMKDDYKDWSVGVTLNLPWGGEERAKYDQKKLEKAQALIAFKRLEQNIILEVRDKVREVDIQMRQVEAARILKEKENQNYKAQEERYAAGQVSTHDMLDYQGKLIQAELDYIKALIDYNIAIFNLDKSQGLTLVKNNVKLEE